MYIYIHIRTHRERQECGIVLSYIHLCIHTCAHVLPHVCTKKYMLTYTHASVHTHNM